jgi:beta-glucosidase
VEEKKLRQLLEDLSLTEKVGQLLQLSSDFYPDLEGEITGPMVEMGVSDEAIANSGSVLGISGAGKIKKLLQKQQDKNKHHIPLLVMADIVHGFKTIFPIPLAMGCTWNTKLVERASEIASKEAAVSGVHVVFAPMVDLVRDPRWGRVMESTGEDPYLNSVMAKASVKGFQGEHLKNDLSRTAACVKHFAAYGAVEAGREYNTVNMSERQLRQDYLPAYKAAIDAGCKLVMTSFNTVDGIPASANKWLLRDLLREEWKFDGTVISDWGAVKELISHGVAADEKEAAEKSLLAGVDIEMMTLCYANYLEKLVSEGSLSVELIDQAVWNILKLKNDLGLFERPTRGADEEREKQIVYCLEHREQERRVAEESCVLLKNNGVLPLAHPKKIALIGPFSDNGDILGSWSWKGDQKTTPTLANVLKESNQFEVSSAEGCGYLQKDSAQLKEAVELGIGADIIILAVGESVDMSGEAASRTHVTLPESQLELIDQLRKLNKPIVAVLFNGRPLDVSGWVDHVDALLEAWYPGSEGAQAIVNLLTGSVNPSGKLSMSFPRTVGQIPVYYNAYNTGRPQLENQDENKYVSKYIDCPNDALFPFGFGLSYTHFDYENFNLSKDKMTDSETLIVSVDIKNSGTVAGSEVVQLYIRDRAGEVVRPLKELKSFKKIHLIPGEMKTVHFEIDESMLRYYHSDLIFKSDPGLFNVMVGGDSVKTLNKKLWLVASSGVREDDKG